MQRSLGVDVEVLAVADAARRVPVDARGLAGATFCAADGRVDPHGICVEYLRRARSLGAGVRFSSPVDAIERDGALWRLRCARAEFSAPIVVNAAGAWAGEVAALAGLDVPVSPARRVVYATAPPAPSPALPAIPCPLTIDLATGLWFRSEGTRLIFGLANPAERGFAQGIDWEWLETTYEAALAHFPWFELLSIDRRSSWWGYYEMTPDHDAVLGPMADAPGWINACGFSGHGVQQAAAVGRLVAQWAAGETGFIDASALSIERFAARPGAPPPAGEKLVV
jgi:sarcosine oxidase, subunit beta